MTNHDKLVRNSKLTWPAQLSCPSELIKCQKDQLRLASLKLIKSPLASKFVLQIVGSASYLLVRILNKTKICNGEVLNRELMVNERLPLYEHATSCEKKVQDSIQRSGPLITISNHISCIDDPLLWGSLLPLNYYSCKHDFVRWSAAAREICFSKPWHSVFFALGKTFPIDRGDGVNQQAMEFALGLLKHNQWLHFFPEGKVMRDKDNQPITNFDKGYQFKWGLAKLIIDYLSQNTTANRKMIRILPFYHLGLDKVLPIGRPYIPRIGKKITIYFRPETIDLNLEKLKQILEFPSGIVKLNDTESNQTSKINYGSSKDLIKLTKYLEAEMGIIQTMTEEFHSA